MYRDEAADARLRRASNIFRYSCEYFMPYCDIRSSWSGGLRGLFVSTGDDATTTR